MIHSYLDWDLFEPFLSFRLVFGTLYPAYSSYKAVKTKDVREYVSTVSEITKSGLYTAALCD